MKSVCWIFFSFFFLFSKSKKYVREKLPLAGEWSGVLPLHLTPLGDNWEALLGT